MGHSHQCRVSSWQIQAHKERLQMLAKSISRLLQASSILQLHQGSFEQNVSAWRLAELHDVSSSSRLVVGLRCSLAWCTATSMKSPRRFPLASVVVLRMD